MKPCFRSLSCTLLALSLLSCDEKKEEEGSGSEDGGMPAPEAPSAPALPTGDTRESLAAAMGVEMKSFGATIASVSDAESWAAAKAALPRIEARIDDIIARLKKLPPPSAHQRATLKVITDQSEEALERALGDKTEFLKKLPPEVARELQVAAGAFSQKMGQAQGVLFGPASPPKP